MKRINSVDKHGRYACLDFETANGYRDSVCSVGLVIVDNLKITDKFYSFVNPMTQYFNKYCVDAHGLTYEDVKNSPTFDVVWEDVDNMINGCPIVSHNAAFERSCINACGDTFGTNTDYKYICTYKNSKKILNGLSSYKLNVVCESCGINLKNHHNALEDAEACAKILINLINKNKTLYYD